MSEVSPDASAEPTGRIQITAVPRGEAELWVRRAWLRVPELPCLPIMGRGRTEGALTRSEQVSCWTLLVPQDEALRLLAEYVPEAAVYWKCFGFPRDGKYFAFREDECRIISGVTMQAITVLDNMETGRWEVPGER